MEDILLRDKLDEMARDERVRVWHVVDHVTPEERASWQFTAGLVSADVLQQHLPPPSSATQVFISGPPGLERAVRKGLESLGYADDAVHDF